MHFRGDIFSADVSIVTRELIPLQTEWTDPYLCSDIDVGERIEDCSTGWLASDRFVIQEGLVELLRIVSKLGLICVRQRPTLRGVSMRLTGTTSLFASCGRLVYVL
jgi:hypothetical protein